MKSPIEDLMDSVVVQLATSGDIASHAFGGRSKAEHSAPPRYVWVPTRGVPEANKITTHSLEDREIGTSRETFSVHCEGSTFAQAWAMRCNLLGAVNSLQAVNSRYEGDEWLRSETGDSFVHLGETLVVTMSLRVPTVDAYIPLDTLTPDAVSTVLATPAGPTVQSTKDLSTDGEAL